MFPHLFSQGLSLADGYPQKTQKKGGHPPPSAQDRHNQLSRTLVI
jgi:hypothetical protein